MSLAAPPFDPALIARYNVDGPRYTSYPTAPHFEAGYGEAEYLAAAWLPTTARCRVRT